MKVLSERIVWKLSERVNRPQPLSTVGPDPSRCKRFPRCFDFGCSAKLTKQVFTGQVWGRSMTRTCRGDALSEKTPSRTDTQLEDACE